MFKHLLESETLGKAVYEQRWAWLVRAGTDIGTIASWDKQLDRSRRILVPIDVQAYVAPDNGSERLVPVSGRADDPAPFSAGVEAAPGIHLHWAMPDALLRGQDAGQGEEPRMPALPDRWVVVRALYPVGLGRPLLRGWVVDARKGSVMPLNEYTGQTPDDDALPSFDRLDGTVGGSPLWTASYHASAGRFGFHDALEDMAELRETFKQGFDKDAATYVVAGWYADSREDVLASDQRSELFDLLDDLRWHLDPEADESLPAKTLPLLERLKAIGYFEQPLAAPPTTVVTKDRKVHFTHANITPQLSVPVRDVSRYVIAQPPPRFLSLLHGLISGVPVNGDVHLQDERPRLTHPNLSVAMGLDTDDLVTALGAATLGDSISRRRAAEMLAAAFTSDLIDRLGTPDGMRDIAEREHADGFWSLPGKPLEAMQDDQLRVEDSSPTNPNSVGRKGRGARIAKQFEQDLNPVVKWGDEVVFSEPGDPSRELTATSPLDKYRKAEERRKVTRPAPRIFLPQAPVVAIRGAKPSLRHHHDGLYDDQGRLRCRYPDEAVSEIKGVIKGEDLVPTLGSGAIPDEVLAVVREALIITPYCTRWLAAASLEQNVKQENLRRRIEAEMLRLYSADGRYDGSGEYTLANPDLSPRATPRDAEPADPIADWGKVSTYQDALARQAAAELAKASYLQGTSPSPVGVTTWRQPWLPLWLEWEVELSGADRLDQWRLQELELKPRNSADNHTLSFTYNGRSPLGRGLGTALHTSIERWIEAEQQRDATEATLNAGEQARLESLADFLRPLNLVSASLDGVREQLLGLEYSGGIHSAPGEDDRPHAGGMPTPLFGGELKLLRLRLVDAFGRTLNVPLNDFSTTTSLELKDNVTGIRMAPRVQNGARWLFRLVDPAHNGDPMAAPEAFVNQLEPELAVNPIAGFLLPDHIDESLEMFDVNGKPIGQLSHHEISGAVRWEPAPGRAVPPGSGPLLDLAPHSLPLGRMAAGVVRSDVLERDSEHPDNDSALTALLRAIDTTLWTVDSYGAIGSASVAGLVGRPIAVVRATLRLDAPDDLDEVRISAPGGAAARRAAFDRLRDQGFPVRLGDLQRSDDSLLGFFVNDDYERFHLVDKVVAATARDSGRSRGQLGLLGQVVIPPVLELRHPLLIAEDTLYVRPGQALSLTLLMLPAGRVHLTSGILPRKALSLSDAWTAKGLKKIIPSIRVGPVLVDPGEVRLPKVHLLGDKQQFTRRTGPLTWRDDPIMSASQSALLPRMPHEFQEGWIRIMDGEEQ